MPSNKSNTTAFWHATTVLLAFCLPFQTFASDIRATHINRTGMTSSGTVKSSNVAPASESAEQMIAILKVNPSLTAELKQLFVQSMQERGYNFDANRMSDGEFFRIARRDPMARAMVQRELSLRGYIVNVEGEDQEVRPEQTAMDSSRDREETARTPTLRRRTSILPQATMSFPGLQDEVHGEVRDRDLEPWQQRTSDVPERRRPIRSGEERQSQKAPEPVDRRSPYANIPALTDLYRQYSAQGEELTRFASDMFENSQWSTQADPVDLPSGADYVLGAGDALLVHISGPTAETVPASVDREGRISLPEVGQVPVAGKSIEAAEAAVSTALAQKLRNAKAELSLSKVRSVRVYVVGDVRRPGAYDISALSTALNALIAAGGPTESGSYRVVRHMRGNKLVREIDLYELMITGVRAHQDRIEAGDTLLVPPSGPLVTVAGMIKRPAIYELRNEKTLDEVLSLGGGLPVTAALAQINVERVEAHAHRTMLSLEIREDKNFESLKAQFAAFGIQDGDKVSILPILPYTNQAVYLDGHVFRPGRYPYRDGMKVSDLLRSYQDLLPEPAAHAEIVRLKPPDLRPTVIEFDLIEALASHGDTLPLEPFDTIRVFGRYELDAPKVSIFGEVVRPGEYPLTSGMRMTELIRAAGGFKRSAMTQVADLTSYKVEAGREVVVQRSTIDISRALAGDTTADLELKPGDVLSIRQLDGWQDIGASITLRGEVAHPGTYGVQAGERLSSVLKRAGGFRPEAYSAGAVLERAQVREIAEQNRAELIRKLQSDAPNVKMDASQSPAEQAALLNAITQQQKQIVQELKNQPATGRLVIRISGDVSKWENTPADIEVRAGDVLTIPKKPHFVMVQGQVYNPTALTLVPGKTAQWYLEQAGGSTELANRKRAFVVRADGSVVSSSVSGWWKRDVLSTVLQPGDTVMVPSRIIGGRSVWREVLQAAQFTSTLAIAARALTAN